MIDISTISKWSPKNKWLEIKTIDAHTEGEPLRIVISGIPFLKGRTVLEKRNHMMKKFDHVRKAIMLEPRGHADMYGAIEVLGEIPPKIPVRQLATKVGSIFDNPEFQMSQLTVFEEVALGLQNLGVDKETIIENITTSLELVGLAGFEERSPFEISGGQQQRLAMASALSMKPQILVLDEPTSNLDPIGKEEVFTVTRRINQEEGLTVIIAEHEVEVIAEYADKVILLEQGKITQVGSPEELFPNIVDIQSNVGVRIPQITDFASKIPEKFKGSIPVTVDQATERYI